MNEIFILEKGPGNFIVKLNKQRILATEIMTIWDKEEDAIRACLLANQAYDLAKKVWFGR